MNDGKKTQPHATGAEPGGEFLLYQTDDGATKIECRFEGETAWLTQALMAELFQITVPTVNEHLKDIFTEGELVPEATIRKFRIVRFEGARQVARELEHYNLAVILAVGYRVRSHRGTQFRQWATARLSEYLKKGFTMDDERLKQACGRHSHAPCVFGREVSEGAHTAALTPKAPRLSLHRIGGAEGGN